MDKQRSNAGPTMEARVRPAEEADLDLLAGIERAADRLFVERFQCIDWPAPTPGRSRVVVPGFILVAECSRPSGLVLAGFTHVLALQGGAHLEQIAVDPRWSRRGIGSELLRATMREAARLGYESMTLRTYADIAWNGPFYARFGFVESDPDSSELRRIKAEELAEGIAAYGRRIQMRASLTI